jgi:hypothetical protein
MGGPTAMDSAWKNLGTGPGDDVVSFLSDEVIGIHPSRKMRFFKTPMVTFLSRLKKLCK